MTTVPDVDARAPGVSYELRVYAEIDTIVITPHMNLSAPAAAGLRQVLAHAVRTHRHILIDMRATKMIDFAGISLLAKASEEADQQGACLSFASPPRTALPALLAIGFDGRSDIFADASAALSWTRDCPPKATSTTVLR